MMKAQKSQLYLQLTCAVYLFTCACDTSLQYRYMRISYRVINNTPVFSFFMRGGEAGRLDQDRAQQHEDTWGSRPWHRQRITICPRRARCKTSGPAPRWGFHRWQLLNFYQDLLFALLLSSLDLNLCTSFVQRHNRPSPLN